MAMEFNAIRGLSIVGNFDARKL